MGESRPRDQRLLELISTVSAQLGTLIQRKRAEEEIRRHRDHLEELVEERTEKLQAANERLEVLARVKDEFVSNVSHELRTPITNLKVYHHLLATNPDELDDRLPVLERETERLNNIIENLLHPSRMDQDAVVFRPGLVNLNVLTSQYVADRAPLAKSKGLSLTVEVQAHLPALEADEGLLGQALGVLLTNALNYTPDHGRVVVRTWSQELQGRMWAGFSVSDTGPGISADDREKLFERFFRGSTGRESAEPGTGLGLAIAKEITDLHSGRIKVESVAGKGATFTVWLPAEGRNHG